MDECSPGFKAHLAGFKDGLEFAGLGQAIDKLKGLIHGRRGPYVDHVKQSIKHLVDAQALIQARYADTLRRRTNGGRRGAAFVAGMEHVTSPTFGSDVDAANRPSIGG